MAGFDTFIAEAGLGAGTGAGAGVTGSEDGPREEAVIGRLKKYEEGIVLVRPVSEDLGWLEGMQSVKQGGSDLAVWAQAFSPEFQRPLLEISSGMDRICTGLSPLKDGASLATLSFGSCRFCL